MLKNPRTHAISTLKVKKKSTKVTFVGFGALFRLRTL